MSLSFTLDASRLNAQAARYVTELGLEGRDVIRDQTRLLLKQVIAFTPPKNLSQGRKAVERDIKRAMTPIVLEDFPNVRMQERVKTLTNRGDAAGLQSIFANSDSWKSWRVLPVSAAVHVAARDKRGRVRKSQHVFAPEAAGQRVSPLRKYIRMVQGFVGRLKAAWAPAYTAVGGSVPAWVARHSNPRGSVLVSFGDPMRPSITIRNYAVGVGQLIHPFRSALRARARSMGLDIKRRLRRAATKSGFK